MISTGQALLVCLLATAYAVEVKRQITALILPAVTKILGDKLGIDKLMNSVVGGVAALFSGKKGHIPLEGTQLVLDYNIHKCGIHTGKRFIIGHLIREECKADVCENKITKSCQSCKKGKQADALKCALELEVKHIQTLAKQAQASAGR